MSLSRQPTNSYMLTGKHGMRMMRSQIAPSDWENLLSDARGVVAAVGAHLRCVHGSTIRRVGPNTYAEAKAYGELDFERNHHAIDGTLEHYLAAIEFVLDEEGYQDCEFCQQLGIEYISYAHRT